MKVYFAPNGMALGHAGRCVPIAKKLASKGIQVLFSTYGDAVEFIKASGLPVVTVPEIKLIEGEDGTVEMLQTSIRWPKYVAVFIRQLIREIELLRSFRPDVVVSDSRLSPVLASALLRIPCILLLHQIKLIIPHKKPLSKIKRKLKAFGEWIILNVLWLMWSRSTRILVPDFPPPYTIAKEHVNVPVKFLKKVRFIGQIIDKMAYELPDKEEVKRKLGFDGRPLIYIGISGTKKERKAINKILRRIIHDFPKDYQIIMSTGDPGGVREVYRGNGVRIFNWLPDRYAVLKSCDLVISRSGHNTIAESMYYGVPLILIPTPAHTEHQMNAKSAEEMGVAKVIQQDELNRETLLKAVREVLESNLIRKRVIKIQEKLLKNNSIQEVINEIILLAGRR